jgi:hypothetical protein
MKSIVSLNSCYWVWIICINVEWLIGKKKKKKGNEARAKKGGRFLISMVGFILGTSNQKTL